MLLIIILFVILKNDNKKEKNKCDVNSLKSRISDSTNCRYAYSCIGTFRRVISERNFRNSNDYLVDSHLGRRNNFMPATRTKAWPVINSSIGFVLFGYIRDGTYLFR